MVRFDLYEKAGSGRNVSNDELNPVDLGVPEKEDFVRRTPPLS
ncbi:MAG TPA: hypothetical protein VGJ40_01215 [Gaiellaceae bacterium]